MTLKFEVRIVSLVGISDDMVEILWSVKNIGDQVNASQTINFRPHDGQGWAGRIHKIGTMGSNEEREFVSIVPGSMLEEARYGVVWENKEWIIRDIKPEGNIVPFVHQTGKARLMDTPGIMLVTDMPRPPAYILPLEAEHGDV